MSELAESIEAFVSYAKTLKGDEKGEAQVFCDRLFQAFGHKGLKEAGAELEYRVKKASGKGTTFADLVWKPRLLIEMKKSSEKLHFHYQQAFDYWLNAVPNRPRYVVLCNFKEFWIYDFDKQLNEPVDSPYGLCSTKSRSPPDPQDHENHSVCANSACPSDPAHSRMTDQPPNNVG